MQETFRAGHRFAAAQEAEGKPAQRPESYGTTEDYGGYGDWIRQPLLGLTKNDPTTWGNPFAQRRMSLRIG